MCHRPAVSVAGALWESEGASKQHDVSVAGQSTKVAEELEEHLPLAALDDRRTRHPAALVVPQHVTLTLRDVRAETCQQTQEESDWLMHPGGSGFSGRIRRGVFLSGSLLLLEFTVLYKPMRLRFMFTTNDIHVKQ